MFDNINSRSERLQLSWEQQNNFTYATHLKNIWTVIYNQKANTLRTEPNILYRLASIRSRTTSQIQTNVIAHMAPRHINVLGTRETQRQMGS